MESGGNYLNIWVLVMSSVALGTPSYEEMRFR